MREVHAGVCGPHMGGHMLAHKIMRTGYFWLTMETDCCRFVQRCLECQIHGDLIHVPPSELHALTSPWPFSVWGIDIIGKISPKSSSGHEFILVAIDYFTKWVEAASYARLTSSGVASFIRSHIICRYGVPHELISDRGVHFRAEVDTLVQRYGIRHHRSSAYRPQTNGAVEAANKNIKRILRKMVETSRDWSEKLPFALWAYRTSFRTSTGATPYSLVYGMEAVLPVEIEMGSLRVALEQQIPETDWAQARFDQLNLLDERRLRAADHVRAYQRKMARAFKKRVKPRPLHVGDLVLRVIRGLIRDPRGKFRPSWSGPYFIRELIPEGAAWLMDLDGNQFSEPTNVDQLKSFGVQSHHRFSVLAFRAVIDFQIDIQSRVLGFGVQSRYHFSASVFRAIITTSLSFGVQSRHRFSDRHSESHPQFQRSESLSLLKPSSIFRSTFRVASSVSAFRVVITSQFDVQSHHHHFLVSAFRAITASQFRHSEPSSVLRSTFRVAFSVSAFRVVITSQLRCSEPSSLLLSVSAFRVVIDFQIDIQSRILGFGVQSRYHFSV
ncbi:hypothetical protein VitviT2T_030329 [Vitis vinifera]|uniref:Integrase catalytic domain-containing protein n=1 Tax=Vitis vinifera TaxID=29760 RepID=A0ABY9E0U4_VITVI|nr:hypothetical protein VitviT2T_030329 [Vitis vinifera]